MRKGEEAPSSVCEALASEKRYDRVRRQKYKASLTVL